MSFAAFAEREAAYFINFYWKWVAVPQSNALAVGYEDLIEQQERTLAAAIGFITGDSRVNATALARALAAAPVGGSNGASAVRDPTLPVHLADNHPRVTRHARPCAGHPRL